MTDLKQPEATPTPATDLTPAPEVVTKTLGQKTAEHFDTHKAKYIASTILGIVLALLQAWPSLCPVLPGHLDCGKSQAIINVATPVLQHEQSELQATGGGTNE